MNEQNYFQRSVIQALVELEDSYLKSKSSTGRDLFFKVKDTFGQIDYDYDSAFLLLDEFPEEIYKENFLFNDKEKIILFNLINLIKPKWINFSNFTGREQTIEKINVDINSKNILQCLEDANLLNSNDLDEKSLRDSLSWWTYLIGGIYSKHDLGRLKSGLDGEFKTYNYEKEKLQQLNINKEPDIVSGDNSQLGYDVLSWRIDKNKKLKQIYIESKNRKKSDTSFFLSRNEYNSCIDLKEDYFLYFWNDDGWTDSPSIKDYEWFINNMPEDKTDKVLWTEVKVNLE